MKARLFLLFVSLMMISGMSACIHYSDTIVQDPMRATLHVYAYGALSGNPRPNITVTLHETQQDAEEGRNALYPSKTTDNNGVTIFYNLPTGRSYWVRAKPLIGRSVRQTDILLRGDNRREMPIL